MAGPGLTKKAIASTFKDLVKEQDFEKVTVMDICDACGVNRKTFYYHFKDKYDLAEWIFEVEFIETLKKSDVIDEWEFVCAICQYFYKEKDFYSKLLKYGGQNSFRQYFQGFMLDSLSALMLSTKKQSVELNEAESVQQKAIREFYLHFISDAVLISIFRWITGGAKIAPQEFVALLKSTAELLKTEKQ